MHGSWIAHTLATGGGQPEGARPTLATVIVLDQFSRHIFRGTPRAFAADPLARRIARKAINHGLDASLREEERLFLYLPFEHSEHRDDQVLSVRLFSQLGREEWRHHALAHHSIIERFGRFPHRNAVLENIIHAGGTRGTRGPCELILMSCALRLPAQANAGDTRVVTSMRLGPTPCHGSPIVPKPGQFTPDRIFAEHRWPLPGILVELLEQAHHRAGEHHEGCRFP